MSLSSFLESEKEKETTDFVKEVSDIMSETNLLDSDEEQELLNSTPTLGFDEEKTL